MSAVLVRSLLASTVAGAALVLSACGGGAATATAEPVPGDGNSVVTGQLTLDWTVNESTDPTQCQLAGVSSIHITPYDEAGRPMGEFAQDCTTFATSIELPIGRYTADAVLENSSGGARTTTIPVEAFSVREGSPIVIDVDFPANSFFQ